MIDPYDLGGATDPIEPGPAPRPVVPVPTPTPTPMPAPVPSRPPAPPTPYAWGKILPWAILVIVLVAVVGLELYRGRSGPAPGPTPKPGPATIDPKLREYSASYFGGYPRWYGDVPTLVAATSPTYNDVTNGILDKRKVLGTQMGQYIDTLVKPLYDEKTLAFKDRAETQRVYRNIEASLIAGIKDAAAGFK